MTLVKSVSLFCLSFFLVILSAAVVKAQGTKQPETRTYLIEEVEHQLKIYHSFDDFAHILATESDTMYVVNFWATWCKPCVKELPYFEQLHNKYATEKVKVVLVSLDFKRQIEKKLIPFLQKNRLNSEVILLLDAKEQEWIDKVDVNWSGAIPITLIFNKYKKLFLEQDFSGLEELEAAIDNFKNLNDEK